ncbi:ROK family transcriptional regulator [Shouchella shacheensis]|uniref:ROK family transcriptional regulator n=1 Tax=Shouchella shacheensis TaxID=1649580 RepID=UPI0007402E56|nr:ROK family protein [Shouchella shacheensis]
MLKHDQFFIKKKNKQWVYDIVQAYGPITKPDIVKQTKMSPTSIGRIVSELIEENLIKERQHATNSVGRNAVQLELQKNAKWSIGIEIDLDIVRLGIMNLNAELVLLESYTHHTRERPEETLAFICEQINQVIGQEQLKKENILGIGIGIPGYVDDVNGILIRSGQLMWKDIAVKSVIEKETKLNVVVDNELKMRAIAEKHARTFEDDANIVLIGIGSGIGSAIIINGEIYRGDTNKAGEIGHTIVNPQGNLCDCGRMGCLATYTSEKALLQQASSGLDVQTMSELFRLYSQGNQGAVNIFDQATTYLAIALGNVYSTFDTTSIILSGSFFQKSFEIRELMNRKMSQYMPYNHQVDIFYSDLKESGVVHGAALVTGNAFFSLD